MKRDQMRRAWSAMALAFVALLALELAYERLPWLSAHFKNSHFLSGGAAEQPEAAPTASAQDLEKPPLTPPPSHTTRAQVRALFAELQSGRRKSLRIAYYADSMTEGDVVTEQLRRDLQGIYGGRGVGFQGMDPRDAGYRVSLIHRPSKEWQRADLHEWRKDHSLPLGINGESYRIQAQAGSASLRLEQSGKQPDPWYEQATLYWGRGDLALNAGGLHFDLHGAGPFNAFPIPLSPQASLRLSISAAPQVWIYGVSLDSPEGVSLDNYTFRGNGGDGLADLSPEMLQAGQKALHYDLVLLHFGINALHHGERDFHWYRSLLRKSFEHLKQNLPGARIVVLGVMDHAEKVDGNIVSDSSLPYVLAAQEAAARDSGLWFINLYEMMGGAGVMRAWVEAPLPLANPDYTHPNRRGGARLAKYIQAALLGEPLPQFDAPAGAAHAP